MKEMRNKIRRHCERPKGVKQSLRYLCNIFGDCFVASLLAMTIFIVPAFAVEPPCHNTNAENHPGELNYDFILNGFVNLSNGNFTRNWQDLAIPGRGPSLQIQRTNNSQIGTGVKDWFAESGTWNIENKEFSGEGDRNVLGAKVKGNVSLTVKMKTVKPGDNFPYEVAWINVCYTDKDNRYTFLINTNGDLELIRYKNGIATGRVRKASGVNPLQWHIVNLSKAVAPNGVTVVAASVQSLDNVGEGSLWLIDQDPLPDGYVCLEAYFSHAHFDDVNVSAYSTDGSITYETPKGPVFSQRPFDNPYANTGIETPNQLNYDFNFTTDDEKSIFGYGWTWNYGLKLQRGPNDALILVYPDRHVDTYTKNADGTYSPPKGVYHILTASINDLDHTKDSFSLTEKSGIKYNFDSFGRLINIIDRNSNQLTLTYKELLYDEREVFQVMTATDSSGRKLTFHYGSNYKVDYIDDPAGRRVSYNYDLNGNLIKVTDPMGYSINYTYHGNYNLKTWTDKEGHIYENTYYYNDRLKTQKDPLGNITTYEYTWDQTTVKNNKNEAFLYTFDDKSRLKWSKDPYGKIEGIAWDENNNKIGVTDKLNNTTNFEYDAKGNQTKIIRRGANGLEDIVSTIEYEPIFNQPTKTTDSLGNITELDYDTKGNLTRTTKYLNDHTPVQTEMTYASNGNLLTLTNALGNVTTYTCDQYSNILTATDALNNKTTFTYDNLSRLLTKTDPKGNTTTYTYDNNNNVLTVTNALGHKVTNTYDKDGRIRTTKDPNNQVTTYEYDAIGNTTKVTDCLGNFSTSEYDAANFMRQSQVNLIKSTDANNHSTTYIYDKLGRLITVIDPLGNQTQKQYDAIGNVLAVIDANNHSTTNAYDCFYRKISITDPLGRKAQIVYDKMGNVIKTIDPSNYSTGYEYDSLYRKVVVTDAKNSSTCYGYDKLGNLIWTRDPNNNTINMEYDALSRKISMDDPDMGHWVYQYDANGNLIKQTDAKGQVLQFEYDQLNRLVRKSSLRGDGVAEAISAYYYDDVSKPNCIGRLSKVVDTNSQTEFFYDALGRQLKTIKTIDSTGYTVQRTYDKKGNLVTLMYPDSEVVSYAYDNADNIKSVAGNSTYVSNVQYTPTNQISQINYGNTTFTNYTYYNDNRLNTIKTKNTAGAVLQDLTYNFDGIGNVSSIADASHTNSQTFKYDELNRLIEASGSYGTRQYGYDAIGNMVLKDFVNYTYGQDNSKPHALTAGSDGTVCEYDANGNMISKNEQFYEYDAENRLISVKRKVTNLATAQTHLNPGWNFLSLPVKPDDNKISSILTGLVAGTDYDQISRFNPITEKFQHYVPDKEFSQFDTFEFAEGYQIYVKNPSGINVSIQGKSPDRKFAISSNWNQIGATSTSSQTQALFLANLQYNIDVNNLSWYNFSTSLYQTPSSIDPSKAYFINGLRQSNWYIQHQNAQLETLATYFYDGDGGRIKKVTPISTTTYIGSIYEVTGSLKTKHIFMGANRVCAVESTGNQFYYHSDHLGSSNIISNKTGVQAGLTEFTPYGSVFTKSGTYDPKYKFTGKELDETGLYFYGARYYDPQLGRFITADPTIQFSFNLQSLNRYSYCLNNPLRYIDPTGYGIGDFFKNLWDDIKEGAGELWDEIKQPLMVAAAVVVSAILMAIPGGQPLAVLTLQSTWIAAAAAAAATATLDTGEGRELIKEVGENFFDDVLGMRPKAAYMWSSVFLHTALTLGYEWGFSQLIADPAVYTGKYNAATDGPIEGGGISPYGEGPMTSNMNEWSQITTFGNSTGDKVFVGARPITGPLSKIGLNHIGPTATRGFGNTYSWVNPSTWATSATCHQVTNSVLLQAGFSNTALGMTWDTYLSTAIYGNYGGGLYVKVTTGMLAEKEY